MKKIICLSLVFMLVLSMAACGQNEKNPIWGSWECPTEIQVFGELPEGVNQGQTIEAVYRFEFNEDGTGKWLTVVDEQFVQFVPDADVSFSYSLEGDKLELNREDGRVHQFTVSFADNKMNLDGRVPMELTRAK